MGIVVTTNTGSLRTWLPDCLESIAKLSPYLYLHINAAEGSLYEAGGIIAGWKRYEKFWHIQDTMVAKDPSALLRLLGDDVSYAAGPRFICCAGKLRSEIIDLTGPPPLPMNKFESATLVEDLWFREYMAADPYYEILDQGFTDKQVFVEKHGRTNMVLESDLFIKYKGTWDLEMIQP